MTTPAFRRYIAPARKRPQLWRLLLGIGVILAVHVAWLGVLSLALFPLAGFPGLDGPEGIGASPAVMVMLLLSFAGLGLGTILAARLLHGRGAASLLGPAPLALRHFTFGALLIGAVNGAAMLLGMGALELKTGLAPSVWLMWLPLALIGVLIQTGAEEAVFRGYLQQQLAARFSSAFVWMVLPSLAFGFLHFEPQMMGANVWYVVAVTTLFGLMAADLTARSGSLGLAWGLHFANNVFAILIVAPQGAMSGLARWQAPFAADDTEVMPGFLLADALLLLLIWAVCRFALRRG